MKIRVERRWPKKTYTVGVMSVDGVRYCETLEPPVVDVNKNGVFDGDEKKTPGHSAIPYGSYRVIYNLSPRFKRKLPRLVDVPHFEGVLIHPGNTVADTAGCILVGRNTHIGRLTQSRNYSDGLNERISAAIARGERVEIEIV